jgi:hypothetical protein
MVGIGRMASCTADQNADVTSNENTKWAELRILVVNANERVEYGKTRSTAGRRHM